MKMTEYPVFSVVILHYNQPKYWEDAIRSVLEQDYKALQLVFADDASSELDIQAITSFITKNRRENLVSYYLQINEVNGKTCRNCNSGLQHCTGDYLLFLDGDDVLYDSHVLTRFAEAFAALPEDANIVTAKAAFYDNALKEKQKEAPSCATGEHLGQLNAFEQFQSMYGNFQFVPSATAYRKKIFEIFGGYDQEHYTMCQDGYWFIHISREGHHFAFVDFLAAKHREGGICNPLNDEVSPNYRELVQDYVTIAEREILPWLDAFTSENDRNRVWEVYRHHRRELGAISGDALSGSEAPNMLSYEEIEKTCPNSYQKLVKDKRSHDMRKSFFQNIRVPRGMLYRTMLLFILTFGLDILSSLLGFQDSFMQMVLNTTEWGSLLLMIGLMVFKLFGK